MHLLQFEPGEVSDMNKLHKTTISHIVGTKCWNFLTDCTIIYTKHTDDVKTHR